MKEEKKFQIVYQNIVLLGQSLAMYGLKNEILKIEKPLNLAGKVVEILFCLYIFFISPQFQPQFGQGRE